MPNLETTILQKIRLAIGGLSGVRLFRNNVGRIEDRFGRYHVFGLCPGSSDLIGFRTIEITPDMVGDRVAVFVAIEVKAPKGRRAPEQKSFVDAVKAAGGLAGFAESVADALGVIV